jgi:hypothetical protein
MSAKLFILLVAVSLAATEAAHCTSENYHVRMFTSDALKKGITEQIIITGQLFMTFGLDKSNFKSCLLEQTSRRPIHLILDTDKETWIIQNFRYQCDRRYKLELVNFTQRTPISLTNQCSEDIQNIELYIATGNKTTVNETATSLIEGCRLWAEKEIVKVKRTLILVLEGKYQDFDMNKTAEILLTPLQPDPINYCFLDKIGLCACDDILNFLDNCQETETEVIERKLFVICLAGLVVSVVIGGMICKRIFSKASETENVDSQEIAAVAPTTEKIITQTDDVEAQGSLVLLKKSLIASIGVFFVGAFAAFMGRFLNNI